MLILLLGLIVGGILDPPFPVMSFATALSVGMLGYAVVSQQLLNPLRERTAELQREIAERERAEKELQRTVSQLRGMEAIINIERIKQIIKQRGSHPGLVHIFSAMESCTRYKPWHILLPQ